jgi:hypothetical protein
MDSRHTISMGIQGPVKQLVVVALTGIAYKIVFVSVVVVVFLNIF